MEGARGIQQSESSPTNEKGKTMEMTNRPTTAPDETTGPSLTPMPAQSLEDLLAPGGYTAYAIIRKKGSGGLWVLRTLEVTDGRIIKSTDSVENISGVLIGEVMYKMEAQQ